jgi:uncharacterized membrane protein YoaK (UPF0700 family)
MQHRPVLMATVLAAVAGWVDALGFFALAGVFTAHLTGNLVLIGEEVVRGTDGLLPKLLVFPAFFAGVVLAALVHAAWKKRGRSSVRAVLLAEAVAVTGFMFAGHAAGPVRDAGDMQPLALLAVLLGALAMGVQNAEGRLALRELGSTAVMTTNITQLLLDVVNAVRAQPADRRRAWKRVRRQSAPVLAFSIGAIVAAFVYLAAGFWGLLPAILALVVLATFAD